MVLQADGDGEGATGTRGGGDGDVEGATVRATTMMTRYGPGWRPVARWRAAIVENDFFYI